MIETRRVRQKEKWKYSNGKVIEIELMAPYGTHGYTAKNGGRNLKPGEHFVSGIGVFRETKKK